MTPSLEVRGFAQVQGVQANDCQTIYDAYEALAKVPSYRQTMTFTGVPPMELIAIGDIIYMNHLSIYAAAHRGGRAARPAAGLDRHRQWPAPAHDLAAGKYGRQSLLRERGRTHSIAPGTRHLLAGRRRRASCHWPRPSTEAKWVRSGATQA